MKLPNTLYKANLCQHVPDSQVKTIAGAYKAKMAMEVFSLIPVVGRIASVTGGYMQLQAMAGEIGQTKDLQKRALLAGQMGATAGMLFLSVLSPRLGGIVSGALRSFTSMTALVKDLQNGDLKAVALDAFRMGNSVVCMCAMVSGNPVFIAVSLVAQGSENMVEGATMLIRQWNAKEKDWMVIGMATLEMGLGALRGYQGASIGAKHIMNEMHKPQKSHLEDGQKPVTGFLSKKQLDRVNEDFEEIMNGKLTYVELDSKGEVIHAKWTAYQNLNMDWHKHSDNKLIVTMNGFPNKSPVMDELVNIEKIQLNWERPLNWKRPWWMQHDDYKSLTGVLDLSEGFMNYLDVVFHYEGKVMADGANQHLSRAIQYALCDVPNADFLLFLHALQQNTIDFLWMEIAKY